MYQWHCTVIRGKTTFKEEFPFLSFICEADPIEALHLGFIYYENPVLFVQAEIGARSRNPLLKGNVTGGIISASVGDLTIQGLRQSVEIVFPLVSRFYFTCV